MSMFQTELRLELEAIKKKISSGLDLTSDEQKLILLDLLIEEDSHENKQS